MKTSSYKKRSYKRKGSARKPKQSNVSFAVKKYVKSTIHKSLENKYHIAFNANQVVGSPYILSLVPQINLGNQVSTRIGNSIQMRGSSLEFVLNNNPYNATTNPAGPVIYRWFIMSQRKDNSSTFNAGGFFEINNSSTNIQNNQLDQTFKPNEANFKVYKQGRITLGTTSVSTAYPSANTIFDNNKISIYKKIWFTKYLSKKIKYDDGGTTPANTNLWFIIIPSYANGSSMSGFQPGNFTYTVHHSYEDA